MTAREADAEPPFRTPSAPGTAPTAQSGNDHRGWRKVTEALETPAFRWFWASQFLSNLGTWSQVVAQAWLVLDLTHSAAALGTITMLQFVPLLMVPLAGGVVADVLPRRQLLVGTQTISAVQAVAFGLLVATHAITVWEIGLLASILGTANGLNNPTQQAIVPELVGEELVPNAIALNSVQFNAARMIGGAVGGLAVAWWGIAGALFLNAGSFLPAIVVFVLIRPAHRSQRPPAARPGILQQLGVGLSYVVHTAPIRRVVLLFGAVSLLASNWQVAVPLIARFVLHGSATNFGALLGSFGAGALLAAVFIARQRAATERGLVAGAIGLGGVLVFIGLSSSYPLSLALLGVAGAVTVVTTVTANTRLQLLSPDHLRGRVMAVYVVLVGGTTGVGGFLLGELAQGIGTRPALIAAGGASLVTIAGVGRAQRSKHVLAGADQSAGV